MNKNGYKAVIALVAIVCIAVMQINAHHTGFNGTVYSSSMITIGGVLAWTYKSATDTKKGK